MLPTMQEVFEDYDLLASTTIQQYATCIADGSDRMLVIATLGEIAPSDWADALTHFGYSTSGELGVDFDFDFILKDGYDVYIITKIGAPVV